MPVCTYCLACLERTSSGHTSWQTKPENIPLALCTASKTTSCAFALTLPSQSAYNRHNLIITNMSATLHIQVSDKIIKEFETVLFVQVFSQTLFLSHYEY